ncbi:MAG: hypothetical protein ACLR07_04320 [Christensenellales bacterium]
MFADRRNPRMAHLRWRRQAERMARQKSRAGFFPEDWAASTTRAVNAGREDLVEGLSRVVSMPDQPYLLDLIQKDPEAFFGKAHLQAFGAQVGFLVKLIDAQERLTIQSASGSAIRQKRLLHSDYGKTESWYGHLQGIELGNPDENAQGFREGYHGDHHYPGVLRRFRLRRCV